MKEELVWEDRLSASPEGKIVLMNRQKKLVYLKRNDELDDVLEQHSIAKEMKAITKLRNRLLFDLITMEEKKDKTFLYKCHGSLKEKRAHIKTELEYAVENNSRNLISAMELDGEK